MSQCVADGDLMAEALGLDLLLLLGLCVVACRSVLQYVAVCRSVLQHVAVCAAVCCSW